MSIFEMGLCSRCWRVSVLLVLLLVSFARANSSIGNATELVSAANETFVPAEGEEAKLEEISDGTKSIGTMFLVLRSGRKPRDEGVQGSGMPGEDLPQVNHNSDEVVTDQEHVEISPDSAETEFLLPHETSVKEDEEKEMTEQETIEMPRSDVETDTDETMLTFNGKKSSTTSPATLPPFHPDILTVGFNIDLHGRRLVSPSPSAHELQGLDPTTWAKDYLTTPLDDVSPTSDEYSTTPDAYSDEPISPPSMPFGPRSPNPSAPARGGGPPATPPGDCRHGYVRSNGTCRSQCDTTPNYCFNGGQCYVLEGIGVFCRCNIQDYVWHKGAHCESVITEFQVLCIAVGASALTVLLLFMIIVCFAKKLHVLKTENNKLRKRSKYRPSSEQHNDNFSLSTIAEGSHPNKTMSRYTWECKTKEEPVCEDDPTAQNKLEEPIKASPPTEDETLNIQNSLTPKHENHKMVGEENSSEVNSLQNNMM